MCECAVSLRFPRRNVPNRPAPASGPRKKKRARPASPSTSSSHSSFKSTGTQPRWTAGGATPSLINGAAALFFLGFACAGAWRSSQPSPLTTCTGRAQLNLFVEGVHAHLVETRPQEAPALLDALGQAWQLRANGAPLAEIRPTHRYAGHSRPRPRRPCLRLLHVHTLTLTHTVTKSNFWVA
jgi:hypothetical protein